MRGYRALYQPRRSGGREGHQHLAGGHGVGANCEQMSPLLPRGSRGRDTRIFLYIFDTKSCIPYFYGSENGHYQCFYQDPYALGEMKTVGRGCRMRPFGRKSRPKAESRVGFLGRGQQAPLARGSSTSSDVNKTKFLRPRPRPPDVNKVTWRI